LLKAWQFALCRVIGNFMKGPPLEGRHILIVEDEPLIAFDIAQAFEPTGAVLTTTATLEHARILVQHDNIAAAVLDHALPDGDSSELCKVLTQRGIPFVVYSGYGPGSDACKEARHLSKPADPELLVTVLQDLILG
jgi:CheY-like chemotaxis protein